MDVDVCCFSTYIPFNSLIPKEALVLASVSQKKIIAVASFTFGLIAAGYHFRHHFLCSKVEEIKKEKIKVENDLPEVPLIEEDIEKDVVENEGVNEDIKVNVTKEEIGIDALKIYCIREDNLNEEEQDLLKAIKEFIKQDDFNKDEQDLIEMIKGFSVDPL